MRLTLTLSSVTLHLEVLEEIASSDLHIVVFFIIFILINVPLLVLVETKFYDE